MHLELTQLDGCVCMYTFCVIGASLSEPHTYVANGGYVYIRQHNGAVYVEMVMVYTYIYLSYVCLGHGAKLWQVQNGQNSRPLCGRCVQLKYSPRIASNEKEIVQNKADTPTSPSGKDTGIGRRNIDN